MGIYTKRITLLIAVIALLTSVPGCSVSEKTCLQNNWQTLGYQHGEDGKSADALNRYVKDCAQHGVTPDASAYSTGYSVGITLYCTAENGAKEGGDGNYYSGTCPAGLEQGFLKNYVTGLRLAMNELELEYQWDSIELNRLQTHRALLATAATSYAVDDGRIRLILSRMYQNTNRRLFINSSIREWSGRI